MLISEFDYWSIGPRSRRHGVAGSRIGKDHTPLSEITSDLGPAIRIGGHEIQTHGPAGDRLWLTVAAPKVFGLSDFCITDVDIGLDEDNVGAFGPFQTLFVSSHYGTIGQWHSNTSPLDEHLHAAEFRSMIADRSRRSTILAQKADA
jgi:hypothetical protein